ncbi:tyrosine-type recombinase/integrase [Roseomonas gilardii]|uniref:tyrosine-type recombinase/integrase n=1 Tax=Roseomonas gilardii TaxID=257708 RepID=UPI00142F8A84|nr:site-specific integrase [Roseomonas gilardii]
MKITKATVSAAWKRREPGVRLTIRDEACRGLALVVNPNGMAWMFGYRPRGMDPLTGKRPAMREISLGTPEGLSPEDARTAAGRHKSGVKSGEDPAAQRRAARDKAARERATTIERLMDAYAATLPKRGKMRGSGTLSPAVAKAEEQQVRAAVATMKAERMPVAELGASEIRLLLGAEAKRPATARHRFGALSRFLDWCQEEGHIALNPCLAIAKNRKPRPLRARTHHLAPKQLAQLWRAAQDACDNPGAEAELRLEPVQRDLIRLMIAVPCRRGEAAYLEWSHINLKDGLWTMPGRLTKNGDPHCVPLPALALDMLTERHAAAGEPSDGLVFPSPKSGKPIATWSDMKKAMDAASGLTGWRWHDFRRSFVTALAENGVAEAVADALLNHRQSATRGGVLGVYQQARRMPERIVAMRRWSEILSASINGDDAKPGKVVGMDRRAVA